MNIENVFSEGLILARQVNLFTVHLAAAAVFGLLNKIPIRRNATGGKTSFPTMSIFRIYKIERGPPIESARLRTPLTIGCIRTTRSECPPLNMTDANRNDSAMNQSHAQISNEYRIEGHWN